MKIIGLTGGTGSGKGFVSERLKKRNAYVMDADKIAHEIIEKDKPAYKQIVDYLGIQYLPYVYRGVRNPYRMEDI